MLLLKYRAYVKTSNKQTSLLLKLKKIEIVEFEKRNAIITFLPPLKRTFQISSLTNEFKFQRA